MAPQIPPVGIDRAHVVGEPNHRIMLADGTAVGILTSYPVRPDADLHSLAEAIEFHCAQCHEHCEATLVAVRDGWLLCPACYAALDTVAPSSAPDARSAA
ncbi:hypothetical protein SacglDRAFT_01935 [Saccharomonospora glauca K62]|uniref:Uncharacterized protein n=2 Tax=Saccharomonospora glauca TaxID=40990 RepID=I1D1M0_9PSEU|nr:hypothetical protein SacglDRAFT_01935 [Saccharomonospora glauca K62]